MKLLLSLLALVCAPLALAACGDDSPAAAAGDPGTLRVALLPDENANSVIAKNEPLKAYLEDRLDKDVELVVTTDYSSMIEAMRRGRVDLGYFGPLSYLLAARRADIEPFAALEERPGDATYRAVLIGNVADGVTSVEQARGKDVAFGDPASTSSHLIPRALLAQAGLQDERDYSARFLGAHDAVAVAVANGNAPVGGLSEPIFRELVERGVIDPERVRVLATSPGYTNYPWTMQASLDPRLKQQIRDAFLEARDPEVLEAFGAVGFAAVDAADYDYVAELSDQVGLRVGEGIE